MIHTESRPSSNVAFWAFTAFVAIVFFTLWGLSGCAYLGVATTGYVEDRLAAEKDRTVTAIGKAVAPIEPLAPGITYSAQAAFRDATIAPPPPASKSAVDWSQLLIAGITTIAGMFGLNTYRNATRDARLAPIEAATNTAPAKVT